MKRAISLGVFLVIAIYIIWSITEDYSGDDQLQHAKNARFVEIFMNDFKLTAMGDDGTPVYILNGDNLEKYNDSDDTEILQPVFRLLQKNGEWKISADNATVNSVDEMIQLKNNVIMQQQNIEPSVTIRTQRLNIDTRKQLAQTTAPVEITQGNSRMNANGMIFNNITSEFKLSSQVNGYYLP